MTNGVSRSGSSGLPTFAIVWLGQLVSLLGSGLTEFGLGVWIMQETGSPTRFVLAILFIALPRIFVSPVAGTLVDRWDRRWAMLLSDAGAGGCTLAIALLLATGHLRVWHVYLILAISSAFSSFQWPAYAASTPLLVPPQHLGRANGLNQVARSLASLGSPIAAGFLVVTVGLAGVVLIDVTTFLFAIATLLIVRFPRPPASREGAEAQGSLLREAAAGWAFLARRPGLLGLMILYAATSFVGITTEVLLTPYILSFSTPDVLGAVVSATGAGLLVGGLIMSAWGGPKRRIYGIVGFEMLVAVCTILIGVRPSATLAASMAFLYFVFIALSDACSDALWQNKVSADFQGRVFAMRNMISLCALPLGLLITAPLAEYVLEPAMQPGGALAASLGAVLGTGPGRGIASIFVLTGVFNMVALLLGYLYPRIRQVEVELPDAVPPPSMARSCPGRDG